MDTNKPLFLASVPARLSAAAAVSALLLTVHHQRPAATTGGGAGGVAGRAGVGAGVGQLHLTDLQPTVPQRDAAAGQQADAVVEPGVADVAGAVDVAAQNHVRAGYDQTGILGRLQLHLCSLVQP